MESYRLSVVNKYIKHVKIGGKIGCGKIKTVYLK